MSSPTTPGKAGALRVDTMAVGALQCNCSIITDVDAKQAVVLDPGDEAARILAHVRSLGADVVAIVHTHGHMDHVGGTAAVSLSSHVVPQMHQADRFLYDNLTVQAAVSGMAVPRRCAMEYDLVDGTNIPFGRFQLSVVHTPGHTPGSVALSIDDGSGSLILFSGDTLLSGTTGRTDLWGGDAKALECSLRERILTLPEQTRIIPGHGGETILRDELENNRAVAALI